jgi:hypothetical protein
MFSIEFYRMHNNWVFSELLLLVSIILNILNFHFTDDAILFLEAEIYYIEILKWILIGFENHLIHR